VRVPGHHPRRAQAEDAERCSDKVFKIITVPLLCSSLVWFIGSRLAP
jgi:hypothetical protein